MISEHIERMRRCPLKKSRVKKIFFWIFFSAMLLEMLALCIEALRPGDESSKNSEIFGDAVDSFLTGASEDSIRDIPPSRISIAKGEEAIDGLEIDCGTSEKLSLLYEPAATSVNYRRVVWNTSDPAVAFVKGGRLYGVSVGEAVLTATAVGSDLSSSIPVVVDEVIAERISLLAAGEEELTLEEGSAASLTFSAEPEDVTPASLRYESSDPQVATVTNGGIVHAVSVGEATVTVYYTPLSAPEKALTATLAVHVLPRTDPLVFPTSLELLAPEPTDGKIRFERGDKGTFALSFFPEETTERALVFRSSDSSVLSVTDTGAYTAKKKGTVTLTVSSATDSSIRTAVTVEVRNRSLAAVLRADNATLIRTAEHVYSLIVFAGENNVTLRAESDAECYVRYETSDEAVAQVYEDGLISTLRSSAEEEGGKVVLTVTVADNADFSDQDGNLSEEFTVLLTVQKQSFSSGVSGWGLLVRKLFGHFGAFLLLGVTASVTAILYDDGTKKRRALAFAGLLVGGFTFASFTEFLQMDLFTSGRAAAFSDVVIDCSGFYIGAAVYAVFLAVVLIIALVRFIRKKKNSS